jgi:hypothetical protein
MQPLDNHGKAKLKQFMDNGINVLQEMDDLRESLKDLTKNVADELDVKPKMLGKALRAAYKQTLADQKDELDEVESVLIETGRA